MRNFSRWIAGIACLVLLALIPAHSQQITQGLKSAQIVALFTGGHASAAYGLATDGSQQLFGTGGSGCTTGTTTNVLIGDGAGGCSNSMFAGTAAGIAGLFSGCSGTLPLGSDGACHAPTFTTLTDGATVTWALASNPFANGGLTFTVNGGSRTLNITNPLNGGNYTLTLTQDGSGVGEGLILGTGCTWKVISGGAGAITPSIAASAIDVLAFAYDGTNCYATFGKNYN